MENEQLLTKAYNSMIKALKDLNKAENATYDNGDYESTDLLEELSIEVADLADKLKHTRTKIVFLAKVKNNQ